MACRARAADDSHRRDIGVPFEEARALEGLGQAYLQDGNPGEAAAYLEQALSIYQRIGVQAARHVQETLHHHGLTTGAADPSRRLPPTITRGSRRQHPQPSGRPGFR